MAAKLSFVEVTSIPAGLNYDKLMAASLNSQFLLCHSLRDGMTQIITEDEDITARMRSSVTCINFAESFPVSVDFRNPVCLIVYNEIPEIRDKREITQCLDGLYSLFGGEDVNVFISFVPAEQEYLDKVMQQTEKMLSKKETRLSKNIGSSPSSGGSMQMELFYGSHERRLLLSMLEMFDEAMANNGLAYKVSIIIDNPSESMVKYLKSKLFVLEEIKPRINDVYSLYDYVKRLGSIPFSYKHAANMISFSSKIKVHRTIETAYSKTKGEILLGNYLKGSIVDDKDAIMTDVSAFNLGTIITGVPGTGKTTAAMSFVSQLLEGGKRGAVVISPTAEWDGFGVEKNLHVIKIYDDDMPINFFKCDSKINIERFYENLAVLFASASNAGPYRNSMEKSLLSAFSKIYKNESSPDPTEAYREIEKAITDQHAKKTNVDVTFTKHGENVMAALQHLRLMLMKPQFAYREGIDFNELINKGVVFDLSNVSSGIKPFFYALILNQIYAYCESLDLLGDDELRLILCLEEAQLVFANNDESAATIDLKQRIQDFRKKGVGLMIITHSITDINIGIRRLCQMKMYFRQSSDVAKYACGDLSFSAEYDDEIMDKIKRLDHGVCALSYVSANGDSKKLEESVFAKTPRYETSVTYEPQKKKSFLFEVDTTLSLQTVGGEPVKGARFELIYVGERFYEGQTGDDGIILIKDTLKEKRYRLRIFGDRKRDTRTFEIIGGHDQTIKLA